MGTRPQYSFTIIILVTEWTSLGNRQDNVVVCLTDGGAKAIDALHKNMEMLWYYCFI